jgi:hypothetical protein
MALYSRLRAPERGSSLRAPAPLRWNWLAPRVQKADHRENADRITASDGGL